VERMTDVGVEGARGEKGPAWAAGEDVGKDIEKGRVVEGDPAFKARAGSSGSGYNGQGEGKACQEDEERWWELT
jgi:hypothetical protein